MKPLIKLALGRQTSTSLSNNHRTLQGKLQMNLTFLQNLPGNYLLVGGHACSLYREPRYTKDIDILVNKADVDLFHDFILSNGGQHLNDLTIGGKSYLYKDQELDILECRERWSTKAFSTPVLHNDIKVISLPFLVLMKLKASRVQDLADISKMLGQASASQQAQVISAVKRYQPSDLEDVESLLQLGILER
jgi:hypothetical protein